jgi:Ca2+-binding RTX toxin-like protein
MTMNTVHGTEAPETIDAADGVSSVNDMIYGLGGDDTIFGLGGDDIIRGGEGADTIDGGADSDFADYRDSDEGIIISLLTGYTSGGTAEGDTLINMENLLGSQYDDVLVGNSEDNYLVGYDGNDVLKGGGGADQLGGLYGDDLLVGGSGADHLHGGDDIDTVAYNESTAGVTVNLLSGVGCDGDAEGDTFFYVENVIGSNHADVLLGDGGSNELEGRKGHDKLKGGGGTDLLWGGGGDDELFGNDGTDTLRGEAGNDALVGGNGKDYLYGGANADTFVWDSTGETGLSVATADVIWDFNAAQGDHIDLSGVDANVYAGGNQAFTFIGTAAFSGTPGEVRYYQSAGNTYIQMQTGTSVDIEGVIRLAGIHVPEASWFVL